MAGVGAGHQVQEQGKQRRASAGLEEQRYPTRSRCEVPRGRLGSSKEEEMELELCIRDRKVQTPEENRAATEHGLFPHASSGPYSNSKGQKSLGK